MMTEEQNQDLAAECRRTIADAEKPGAGYRTVARGDIARIALAALTQPASPALKLPDGWVAVPNEPTEDMIAAGSAVDGGVYSIWKDMVFASPDAPHTAPIEPICATGRTMPPHEFSQMVNELRDVDNTQSRRAKIVGVLHAFNIRPRKPE